MLVQQIRNATVKIVYQNKTILIDPWLAPQYAIGSFAQMIPNAFKLQDKMKANIPMPIAPLPMSVEDILRDVDAIIITHIHPDHVDMMPNGHIGECLPHHLPVFVQNEADASILSQNQFNDVRVLSAQGTDFEGITITKTPCRHGTIEPCGQASGFCLEASQEPKFMACGDTVWYPQLQEALRKHNPEVVLLNACAAELEGFGRLIMNDEDVACVAATLPEAHLIISHMDTVAHASISRYEMRGLLTKRQIANFIIPEDGESLSF